MKFYYQRLKDLKEDANLKQKDVAEIIEVAENHYGKYERGEVDITLGRAIKLAEYYDVSLDYLAGRTNDKGGLHCNYLDPEQKKLLNAWEQLSSRQKSIMWANIEEFIEREPRKEERKSAI